MKLWGGDSSAHWRGGDAGQPQPSTNRMVHKGSAGKQSERGQVMEGFIKQANEFLGLV